jgi:hypothetical protein
MTGFAGHRFVERGGLIQLLQNFSDDHAAGYFSHLHGATYLSPIHHSSNLPTELIELHETIHQNLSSNNTTDLLARIFSFIRPAGG